jgi:FixJ family two-component response regulator
MQAVDSNTDFAGAPRVYRNRPHSFAFNSPRPESLSDVIYLVEADADITEEIALCFSAMGVKVSTFSSAAEYLAFDGRDSAACLILNTHLPDMSGFELQRCLKDKGNPPVIFISDHRDVALAVRAMKAGAIEFLPKPIDLQVLVTNVQAAFAQDRRLRLKRSELAELQERFALLTPREREVLPLVVGGLLNKQAASVLGISEVTLQIHRSQVMRKTRAESLAELVRMAMKLRIPHWREKPLGNEGQLKAVPFGLQSSVRLVTRGALR